MQPLKKWDYSSSLAPFDDLLAVSLDFTFSAPSDFKIKSTSMLQSITFTVKIY